MADLSVSDEDNPISIPSNSLVALVMREPWQYDDNGEYVPSALRGLVPHNLKPHDRFHLYPNDEGYLVQANDSRDWGWAIFIRNRINIHGMITNPSF
jgi:hypothetical protein